MDALNTLAPEIGLARACVVLRIIRARIYRQDARRRCLTSSTSKRVLSAAVARCA
jgi:hypothetical protein